MKYFLLLFVAYGPHAMDMFETEAKDKGSKYLLVKIEDKNEPVQYIGATRLNIKGSALKDLLFLVLCPWSIVLSL